MTVVRTSVGALREPSDSFASAAILNDLVGWTFFALILGMIGQHGATSGVGTTVALTLLFAALMLTAGRWIVHRVLPWLQAYTHWPAGALGFIITLGLSPRTTSWTGSPRSRAE